MLTKNEIKVIKAYKDDDFVSDFGWDNPSNAGWVKGFHNECKLDSKTFSGTMSSLVKKGIFWTNGEAFGLTNKGIQIAEKL